MSNVQVDTTEPDQIASSSAEGQAQRFNILDGHHPLSLDPSEDADAITAQYLRTLPHATRSRSAPLGLLPSPEDVLRTTPIQILETNPQQLQDASTEARNVRRNMFLAAWNGFTVLAKSRKWILTLRLLIGLGQLVLGIVILSLSSSMGISGSIPDTCDPKGMFVFLTLHVIRVGFSIPIDFYLALSPHRTPSARRIGAEGQSNRERNRTVGSLALDRKLSRFSDLLGLCHVVLFIVGNYTVWTSLECSQSPAKSRPLWIACVCMLSVTYTIIVEVMLMIFLLVFFLPLLLAILRALGLANHLPQRGIRPETGKINQDIIEEQSRLVYFTLARDEVIEARSSREDLESLTVKSLEEKSGVELSLPSQALEVPLPMSRTTSIQSRAPSERSSVSLVHTATLPRRRRLGLLFGFTRRTMQDDEVEKPGSTSRLDHDIAKEEGKNSKGKSKKRLKYPIYPVPAHRATCSICLCDFEEIPASFSKDDAEAEVTNPANNINDEEEVEPLRLLKCGHLMHMKCVDEWLTTVSGRCPVCQKPLVPDEEETNPNGQDQQATA